MRTAAVTQSNDTGLAGALVKLRAWWNGAEPRHQARKAAARPGAARPGSARSAAPAAPKPVAPLDPLRLAQWLWGTGFSSPGGEAFILELVKPFGLTPAMSMLDLSAGIGGPARAIAKTFGTWVTGLERSPEMAALGMQMSKQEDLEKKAAIAPYDPDIVEFRKNAFDCVLARGATYAVADKERLFQAVIQGLKSRGQLLMTEYVRVGPPRPELEAWAAHEPYPPTLWTLAEYTACLSKLGYDIRITEDMTAVHRSAIIGGWAQMLAETNLRELPRSHGATVADAAEFWMRRVAALESGALQVYRIYALSKRAAG
jgi:SAM-dependent methyltransferase